jgi:hypothetical protein
MYMPLIAVASGATKELSARIIIGSFAVVLIILLLSSIKTNNRLVKICLYLTLLIVVVVSSILLIISAIHAINNDGIFIVLREGWLS